MNVVVAVAALIGLPPAVAERADADVLVSSSGNGAVQRYDETTKAFLGTFASGSGLTQPTGLTFGPDGNLYVGNFLPGGVERFDGLTGAHIDHFTKGGNTTGTFGLTFGPDKDLYWWAIWTPPLAATMV
jgi:DNA-binding beta-propeller fold protein YncE